MSASLILFLYPIHCMSCEICFNVNDKCDHKAIAMYLNLNKVKTKDNDKPVYCLKRVNFDQMRGIISSSPWNVCNLIDDISN